MCAAALLKPLKDALLARGQFAGDQSLFPRNNNKQEYLKMIFANKDQSLPIVPEPGLNEQSIKEEYHKIPPALIDAIRIQVFDGRQVSNYAIVLVYKFACKVVFNATYKYITSTPVTRLFSNVQLEKIKKRLSANNNEVDAEIIQMIFTDQAVHLSFLLHKTA